MNFTPFSALESSSFNKEEGKEVANGRAKGTSTFFIAGFLSNLVSLLLTGPIKKLLSKGSVQNKQINTVPDRLLLLRQKEVLHTYYRMRHRMMQQKSLSMQVILTVFCLQEALNACFRNQPLTYYIIDKTIIVKQREDITTATPTPRFAKLPFVKGTVTSDSGPVAGASVTEKGTKNGTSTNINGEFTLSEVGENATLVVSSVSHETQEIYVGRRVDITVALKTKVNELDEQVVVAYSTTTQRRATGSFTVVKGEEIQPLPNRSFDRSLQGMVPGLLVTSYNGQSGSGVSNIVLRGIATGTEATLGSTVRNPLIVIDGVAIYQDHFQLNISSNVTPISNPTAQLNPSDIESITVLKDAAAISLYGAKSSNGVILVTTPNFYPSILIFVYILNISIFSLVSKYHFSVCIVSCYYYFHHYPTALTESKTGIITLKSLNLIISKFLLQSKTYNYD